MAKAHTNLRYLLGLQHRIAGNGRANPTNLRSAIAGQRRAMFRGHGLDFDELRHYRPGDDVRAMDWRVTQRMGAPFVRVYREERDRPIWLLVDQRQSLFFGSQRQMKSVLVAELATLLAWQASDAGDRVGAVLLSNNKASLCAPARSKAQLSTTIKAIHEHNSRLQARTDTQQTGGVLRQALQLLASRCQHDGVLFVLSDFADLGDAEITALKYLRQRNHVVACAVSDPLERDVSAAQSLVVSDGQHQLALRDLPPATLARYRASFEHHRQTLAMALNKARIPLIEASTEDDATVAFKHCLYGATTAPRSAS